MRRNWPILAGVALLAFYFVWASGAEPKPGYIQFLTSIVLPASILIIVAGLWIRRNTDRKGHVRPGGDPNDRPGSPGSGTRI